jgi:hypothetical protein
MKIIFSKHVLKRLKERKINRRVIRQVIKTPDYLITQPNNRFRALKLIKLNVNDHLLIIIFERIDDIIKIITAFITSKIEKYLK